MDEPEMLTVFELACRLKRESGLKHHERQALKKLFGKLSESDRHRVTKHVGTQFIESIHRERGNVK